MPYTIFLENLPIGIALNSVHGEGEVKVVFREFTSSEDGDLFIQRLEGFPNDILNLIPTKIKPSAIDHMLVLINQDKSAIVYINELQFILKIRPKRTNIKAGDPIFDDDIAEIESMEFKENINITKETGVIFLFSSGWRKGLFFDLGVFHLPPFLRDYDFEKLFGHFYSYLDFQHLFKIADNEWDLIFNQMWFPFISLRKSTIQRMISYVKSNLPLDDLLPDITKEVKDSQEFMLKRWEDSPILSGHIDLIRRAVERYENQDYVSATSILYPRIEGIMREVSRITSPNKSVSAKKLTENLTLQKEVEGGNNILLPKMFHKYLDEVYFRNFDPNNPTELSRNTIAHGVAKSQDFSNKAATIGFLILDQLFYFIPTQYSK